MSTLQVNTIRHNTSGFNNVIQFADGAGTQNGTLCRVWVNFNGQGTIATRSSFNVNSLTDLGTGAYTINFSNSLSDANFSACGNHNSSSDGQSCLRVDTFATSSLTITCFITNATVDPSIVTLGMFR